MLERSTLGSAWTLTCQLLGAEARKLEQLWTVSQSCPIARSVQQTPKLPSPWPPRCGAAVWVVELAPGQGSGLPKHQGREAESPL